MIGKSRNGAPALDEEYVPLSDAHKLLAPAYAQFTFDIYYHLDRVIKSVVCDPTCAQVLSADELDDGVFCPHKAVKSRYKTHEVLAGVLDNLRDFGEQILNLTEKISEQEKDARKAWEDTHPQEDSAVAVKVHRGHRIVLVPEASASEAPTTIPKPGLVDLPAELLGEVLLIAKLEDRNIPVVFTAVNSFLRNVTISNPLLWSDIHIMHGPTRTLEQLARSQQVPLTVCASLQPNFTAERGEALVQVFIGLLVQYSHRIRHFESVNCWPEWTEHAVEFLEGNSFDRLESLDVGLTESTLSSESVEREVTLTVLSGVRELTLRGTRVAWPPANAVSFRFNHLTTLHMIGYVTDAFGDILVLLNRMPSLQHLSIRDPNILPSTVTNPPVPLPNLKTLSITRAEHAYLQNLLRSINTPNLESLTIHFVSPHLDVLEEALVAPGPVPGAIMRNVVEANSQLQQVDLTNCLIGADEWDSAFLGLSALTHIRIASSNLENRSLQTLTGLACPNLEHITLDNELQLSTDVVRDIVSAHGSSIQELALRGWDPDNVKEEHILEIQEVVEVVEVDVLDMAIIEEAPPDDVSDSDAEVDEDWGDGWMASGDEMVLEGMEQNWEAFG